MTPRRKAPEALERLLTRREVADVLRCSERTVSRLWKAGLMPKPLSPEPNLHRWSRAELAAWIEAGGPSWEVWREMRRKAVS